ncbi:ABC transporter permease [Jeotgalibaca caeni]|uniref:ABC transporter permease n=1 Tax=Jeotgalibaca caeni TaxID=3028623 RepID=UPI00237D4DE2|nr:iron ABC transporter permease [Jeotgalibaca caeni]MDE1549170.1 iron ABC transporter permease [Jeotgalibaca caeni]
MSNVKPTFYRVLFLFIGLAIFLFPLLTLFKMSLETDGGWGVDNFTTLFESGRTIQAIQSTLVIAVWSTLIAAVLGIGYAVLVAYTNVRFKRLIELLIILPYVIPGYVVTLSWTVVFSGNSPVNHLLRTVHLPAVNMYSLTGIIFVLGLSNAALVYLNVVDILRKVPQEQEWASQVAGYRLKETLRKINFKSVRPALVSGIILAFLSSIDNFAIPATLGSPAGITVLSTYIYEKAIGFGPNSFNQAAVLSIFLSMLAFIGIGIQWWVLRKSVVLDSSRVDYSPRIHFTKRKRSFAEFLSILFLVVMNMVPLVVMFFSSLQTGYSRSIFDPTKMGWDNYQFIFQTPAMYEGFLTSFWLTILSIVVCIGFSIWVMYYKQRIDKGATLPIEIGASLTFSTPGIVLALSMIFYWSKVPNVYGTIWILFIAYVTRYVLLLLRGSNTALLSVGVELEEAAMISGSKRWEKWTRIIIPLIKNQVLASSFLMFTSAFTELTLSSLLIAADSKTVGLTIFNLQTGGDNQIAQAYSVLLTIFIMALVLIRSRLEQKEMKKHA